MEKEEPIVIERPLTPKKSKNDKFEVKLIDILKVLQNLPKEF